MLHTAHSLSHIFQLVKQIDTVEVIRHYGVADLYQRGRRWVARCPLHGEKRPSFYVFPDGGWRCFGCGEHGDVVDIVAKVFGLRPIEAARMIARDFGLATGGGIPEKAKAQLRRAARERHAERLFDEKRDEVLEALQLLYRCTHRALALGGWQAYQELSELVHQLPTWEHLLECLLDNDIEIQAEALVYAGRYLHEK